MKKGYGKLKGYLVERGIKQSELAKLLGIDRATLNKKLNQNKADFTICEVKKICNTYKLDSNLFFLF